MAEQTAKKIETMADLEKAMAALQSQNGMRMIHVDPARLKELALKVLKTYPDMSLLPAPSGADWQVADPYVDPKIKEKAKRRGRPVAKRRVVVGFSSGDVWFTNCEPVLLSVDVEVKVRGRKTRQAPAPEPVGVPEPELA